MRSGAARIHDGGDVLVCHVRSAVATHDIALECRPEWSAAALVAQILVELGRCPGGAACDQLAGARVVAPDVTVLDHDAALWTIDDDHVFIILPEAGNGDGRGDMEGGGDGPASDR